MPAKTQPRARSWGTRFDSLLSSPPQTGNIGTRDATPSSVAAVLANREESLELAYPRRETKMPHDASIFVGSLPSNIEQPELARLLSEHLSEHAEVKNVKVVRDSKGGVCAFVQCEDASAAASLIHTIHSSPARMFLGRFLRYEPARAFRTLLVSYRTPAQFVPPIPEVDSAGNVVHKAGRTFALDLPTAMRLWRPRNSKYFNILYNTEANDSTHHSQNNGDPIHNPGLLLQPISFDVDTMQTLCAFFGPLEHFKSYPVQGPSSENEPVAATDEKYSFPYPHHTPRSPGMDAGCWEVKWDYRDDCISALMTLRRVPHLTVTWAHQPQSQGYEPQHPYQFQRYAQVNAAPYPLHVQADRGSTTQYQSHREPSHTQIKQEPLGASDAHAADSPHGRTAIAPNGEQIHSGDSPARLLPASQSSAEPSVESFQGTSSPHSSDIPNQHTHNARVDLSDADVSKTVAWSDRDFPPLSDTRGDRRVDSGVWTESKMSTNPMHDEAEARHAPGTKMIYPIDSSIRMSPAGESPNVGQSGDEEDGQDLDIPPTPEFGRSPITPKASFSHFPKTPTSGGYGDFHGIQYSRYDPRDNYSGDGNSGERDLDPTTIFVGGLEMFGPNAWDEDKVHSHFAKFGGVENVKVVRPVNSRSAFAFVKFNNTEGPARAVSDEHDRILDGRPIRVQLRDINPPNRGGWKYYGRGRGRVQHPNGQANEPHIPSPTANAPSREILPATDVVQHAHVLYRDGSHSPMTESTNNGTETLSLPAEVAAVAQGTKLGQDEETQQYGQSDSENIGLAHSSPKLAISTEAPSGYEHYREWYDTDSPSVSGTPPCSSLGSSASASAPTMPYPSAAPSYYPFPWMQPYAPPYPYPVAFVPGYGYVAPPQQPVQTFASPPGSDSGALANTVPSWPTMTGVYPPAVPYAPYPMSVSQTQPFPAAQTQAPLVPTGFMQGEQGTLIPVYQPEALNQYMSGGQASAASSQTQSQPRQAGWPPAPQSSTVSYTAPIHHAGMPMSTPSQQFGANYPQPPRVPNVTWTPTAQAIPLQQHLQPHQGFAAPPSNLLPVGGQRGSVYGGVAQGHQQHFESRGTPPPPRRQHRRDQGHHYHHMNRNQNGRGTYPNRHARMQGGVEGDHDYVAPPQIPAQPSINSGADWTQWTPGGR